MIFFPSLFIFHSKFTHKHGWRYSYFQPPLTTGVTRDDVRVEVRYSCPHVTGIGNFCAPLFAAIVNFLHPSFVMERLYSVFLDSMCAIFALVILLCWFLRLHKKLYLATIEAVAT